MEQIREEVQLYSAIQRTLNALVFGGFTNVQLTTAQQPVCDVCATLALGTYTSSVASWRRTVGAQFARQLNERRMVRSSFKYQQHAPPSRLPPDTVSYYTNGDGDARKKGEPPPPAGYGVMALTGGVGRDHAGGHHILSLGGQIVAGGSTPRVRTTTINLGHLMGLSSELSSALTGNNWQARERSPRTHVCEIG